MTYYTAFVIDVQSRRVQVIGCTPYPDEAFVIQSLRPITGESVRVVRTPPRAPNCNVTPSGSSAQ